MCAAGDAQLHLLVLAMRPPKHALAAAAQRLDWCGTARDEPSEGSALLVARWAR
jgi:hypothetical protein